MHAVLCIICACTGMEANENTLTGIWFRKIDFLCCVCVCFSLAISITGYFTTRHKVSFQGGKMG